MWLGGLGQTALNLKHPGTLDKARGGTHSVPNWLRFLVTVRATKWYLLCSDWLPPQIDFVTGSLTPAATEQLDFQEVIRHVEPKPR